MVTCILDTHIISNLNHFTHPSRRRPLQRLTKVLLRSSLTAPCKKQGKHYSFLCNPDAFIVLLLSSLGPYKIIQLSNPAETYIVFFHSFAKQYNSLNQRDATGACAKSRTSLSGKLLDPFTTSIYHSSSRSSKLYHSFILFIYSQSFLLPITD